MIRCVMLITLFLAIGCEEKIKPTVLTSLNGADLPQQESWNSQIVLSDSGRVKAIVDAGYLRVFESSKKTLLSESVRVRFFNRDGSAGSILTSEEGAVDEGTNDLEARGNVIVTSPDRTVLYSEELYWDEKRQLIHTPVFVRIISPKERLQGIGMESDQQLLHYRIFRVTGETTVE